MKKIIKFVVFILWLIILNYNQVNAELIKPKQYGSENRFKACTYDPKGVYYIPLYIGHPMYLEFEDTEKIDTIYTPNKKDFEIVPVGNKLFLKSLKMNSDTTLTVMTNQRNYFFELHVKEPKGPFDRDITFFIKFRYPSKVKSAGQSIDGENSIIQYSGSELPDLSRPDKYNLNYTMSGDISIIGPEKVFDDGKFTYFQFREHNTIIPAIFLVDKRGYEQSVNFRMIDSYVIVESTNAIFTLRHGADTVCIFNETAGIIQEDKIKEKIKIKN